MPATAPFSPQALAFLRALNKALRYVTQSRYTQSENALD